MADFNSVRKTPTNITTNRAGGVGYSLDARSELVGILMTSLAEDTYYETADARNTRLGQVMAKVDPLFAAKAAIYARDVMGMRSITHIAAAVLAGAQFPEKRAFYRNIVVRPDDALSILAAYGVDGQPLPNAMKRGIADKLSTFKAGTLAKYKSTDREVNMYDVINLVHPKSAAIDAFMKGNIRTADTWEVAISAAQGEAAKSTAWRNLVLEGKLGYMALLRNLRNIVEACGKDKQVMDAVYAQLTDREAVLRSRQFPYRYLAAYYTFTPRPVNMYSYGYDRDGYTSAPQALLTAINKAAEISLELVPELPGSSAILMDVSGSMDDTMSKNSKMRCVDAGAMLGAMLYKKNPDAELVQFGDRANNLWVNADMPLLEIAKTFAKNPGIGHGTNVSAGFQALKRAHERIMVVSDMQTWRDSYYGGAQKAWNAYNQRMGVNSFGYEIDLRGYGQTALNNRSNREFYLPTITDKIFMVMDGLETGTGGLIAAIEKVAI